MLDLNKWVTHCIFLSFFCSVACSGSWLSLWVAGGLRSVARRLVGVWLSLVAGEKKDRSVYGLMLGGAAVAVCALSWVVC